MPGEGWHSSLFAHLLGGERVDTPSPPQPPLVTPPERSARALAATQVMILMSDTGGGHRASAKAIEDALTRLYPGRVECDIVDMWTDHR